MIRKKINYPSKIDDWKKSEKNNPTIALNILCNKQKKYFPLIFQIIPCEKPIILLMILNKEKEGWHYLGLKKLPTLLRGITSKHHGNFYCLNCLHSF